MTGIILAGGKNSRIKPNKAFIRINGAPIIETIVNKFKKLFGEIIIVANSAGDYEYLGVKLVKDIIYGGGPLGGLYAGLVNSKSKYNFAVACDMPFLNTKLIEYMKSGISSYDALIPKLRNGYEALHAIYSKKCVPVIEKQLNDNNLRIIDLLPRIRVKIFRETALKKFDPLLISFFNLNTNADYRRALEIRPRFKNTSSGYKY